MSRDVDRIRALVEVSRLRAEHGDLRPLVEGVARTVAETLGFEVVAVNLRRPAWDDFEVAAVHGNEDAHRALAGTTLARETWDAFLDQRFRRHGCYLLPHDEVALPEDEVGWWRAQRALHDGPDAWHPEDALFAPMHGPDGELLGIISADEPLSGRRPQDADLEALGAIAAHAGLVVAGAIAAAEAAARSAALDH